MTIKEFFSFKTNKFFWVNMIAMIVVVVVMIFGVLKWLDIHTPVSYTHLRAHET
mgnify:FL=1